MLHREELDLGLPVSMGLIVVSSAGWLGDTSETLYLRMAPSSKLLTHSLVIPRGFPFSILRVYLLWSRHSYLGDQHPRVSGYGWIARMSSRGVLTACTQDATVDGREENILYKRVYLR